MASRADVSRLSQGLSPKMDKFESAISFALQRLDNHDLVLKPEQTEAVRLVWEGNTGNTFVHIPTGFGNVSFMKCYRLFLAINLKEWMG